MPCLYFNARHAPAKLKFAFAMPAARFLFISLLLSLLTFFGAKAQVAFRVEVLYDEVGVNKAFQVQYNLENAGNLVEMRLQPASPFTVIGNYADASRTSTQILNGKATTTRTYTRTYTLRASQTGSFQLPAAVARTADGNTYRSDPRMIEVVKEDPRKAQPPQSPDPFGAPFAGGDPFGPDPFGGPDPFNSQNPFGPGSPLDRIADAFRQERRLPTAAALPKVSFLQIVPQKTTAYEGEPIIVEYLLVSAIPVSGNLNKMPAPDGFWVEEISGEKEERGTKMVGNQMFETLLIKRVALIPQRTGHLTIEPAEMQAVGTIDDGFGNTQQHSWTIKSAPATLQINPLPQAGKPTFFNGAVGNFQIKALLEPPTMPRNGAAALRITVSGAGNLTQLDAPQIQLPDGLQAADAVAKNDLKTDGQRLTGSRTFTYPITASKEGNFTIPPIRFSFFNPQSGKYEEAATQPLTLSVTTAEAVDEKDSFSGDTTQSFWPAALFALIALTVGVLIWRRRHTPPTVPTTPESSPLPTTTTHSTPTPLPETPEIPEISAPATVREALSAVETMISGKTGLTASMLSVQRLEALGMDAFTAQRIFIFRKKAEAALYGGLPASDADLLEEGRALLSLISAWQPPQTP